MMVKAVGKFKVWENEKQIQAYHFAETDDEREIILHKLEAKYANLVNRLALASAITIRQTDTDTNSATMTLPIQVSSENTIASRVLAGNCNIEFLSYFCVVVSEC